MIAALSVAGADPAAPQLHVYTCRVISGTPWVPRKEEVAVSVRFVNDSPDTLASIVWRATYNGEPIDFTVDGEFSPNIVIDNNVPVITGSAHINPLATAVSLLTIFKPDPVKFSIQLPMYAGTEDPENCTIVRVVRQDGSLWENPNVPQGPSTFATPPPLTLPDAVPSPAPSGVPIAMNPCSFDINRNIGLGVKYRNDATKTVDSIVFRATYEQSGIDFTDTASVEPDSVVAHYIKEGTPPELQGRFLYDHDDAQRCSVVRVHFADGSSWINPDVPQTPGPLPTPIASEMPFNPLTMRFAAFHGTPTPLPSSSASSAPGTPR
ncbi:MAG: hypothetical protein WBD74_08500 [Candidatus Aquilonibacter sp.]